mgnify:CR=1 FL=1|tara:strand:- start:552 stop:893 length:342 start_codon:yes stop_codon:yes gene_type:complete
MTGTPPIKKYIHKKLPKGRILQKNNIENLRDDHLSFCKLYLLTIENYVSDDQESMDAVKKGRKLLSMVVYLCNTNKNINDSEYSLYDYNILKIKNKVYQQLLVSQNSANNKWL